jgi:hypothetical protein
MQEREDIEDEIEVCKEEIYERQYHLRWFTRFVYLFWPCLIISIITFAIFYPLNVPVLQPILENVGGISATISIIMLVCVAFSYFSETSFKKGYHDLKGYEVLEELRKEKRTLNKLLRRLEYYDEQAIKSLSPTEQRKHELPDLIASYRKRADRYRGCFTVTQIVIILLSATITSISGGWLDKYRPLPWAIPVFSGAISIITSFTLFFKPREKGANLQQTADAMDLEYTACNLGIEDYEDMDDDEALVLLAKRTEDLRKDQQQRQQQLEQSSQAEQKVLQPDGK